MKGGSLKHSRVERAARTSCLTVVCVLTSVACAGGAAGPDPGTEPQGAVLDPGEPGLPAGFEDDLVAEVPLPTAVAFAESAGGQILVTSQPGQLFHLTRSGGEVALDLLERTCSRVEQGMLSVRTDPDFSRNGYVYIYYTAELDGECFNRVSRFTLAAGGVDPASETVLIDRIPSVGGNHNAGDLQFGPDGLLYVSVGDSGCAMDGSQGCAESNPNSRDESTVLGKILRIRPDGSIPDGNPFAGPGSARCNASGQTDESPKCQETYAWGLRNPFRMAFDPGAGDARFLINDPGQDEWEEINEGVAGADYGWNLREGPCTNGSVTDCPPAPQGMADPLFAYRHGECNVVTGGAFVPEGLWPQMDGAYLFGDFGCGAIFRLVDKGDEHAAEPFAAGLGTPGPVDMQFGPHGDTQALYYTTYAGGGQVRRISYTGQEMSR